MFDGLKEKGVQVALAQKGYAPDVITVLVKHKAESLWNMDQIDNNTFGDISKRNPRGKLPADMKLYNDAVESLRVLGRNSPAFATNVANRYDANPSKYERDAKTFANELYEDPAMCAKVIELAKGQKIQELNKMATNPATYMAQFAAPTLAKPEQSKLGTTPPSSSGQVGVKQKSVRAAASAPAPQSTPSPVALPVESGIVEGEVLDDEVRIYTSDQAKARFGKMMADPKNAALAKKISEKEGLRQGIEKEFDRDPQLVRNFLSKGNRAAYLSFLEKNDVNGFMQEFSGSVPIAPMPDMSSMMGDMKGMLGSLGGIFSGMFEGVGNIGDIMSRLSNGLGDPVKNAAKASQDTGAKIAALLESTDPEKRAYGEKLLNGAMGAVSTSDPMHARHEKVVLMGAGVNVALLEQAQNKNIKGLDHIKIGKDPKTGVKEITGDPVPYISSPVIKSEGTPIKVQISGQAGNDPRFEPVVPTGTAG